VLRHELAHVFAGAAGDRLLRLALRYGLPQPGIIEGLAVAAEWRGSGVLDSHQLVLAMRRAGLEPPLHDVLGLGFWRLPAGRAYTVAGSFCRYLLERYGAAPLLAAYRRGGGAPDFAQSFGQPFARLESDWRQFVDGQPLEAAAQEVAGERLRRKAVFHKVCAHELALRKQEAHEAAGRGDRAQAVRLISSVCQDDPDEPSHQQELVETLIAADQEAAAEQAALRLLAHPQRTAVLEARVAARLGDLAVRRGDLATAKSYYQRAAAGPDGESAARLVTAKLTALGSTQAGPLLLRVLVGVSPSVLGPPSPLGSPPLRTAEFSDPLAVYTLLQAVAAEPALGLTHYVLGRLLYERGGFAEAERELKRSLELGLPDGRFEFQALLLRGQAALQGGQSTVAETMFTELLGRVPVAERGKRLDLEDLRDRAHRWPSL
jgi:tetratricopeptide (TPR) repeat protein